MNQIFQELNQNSADRPHGESPQNGRKIREIEFDKRRHKRHRNLQQLQYDCHCCQHSGHCYVVNSGVPSRPRCFSFCYPFVGCYCFHFSPFPEIFSSCYFRPEIIKRPDHSDPGGISRNNTAAIFFHPDFTVGTGLSPVQLPYGRSRTYRSPDLPPVGNCTPPTKISC